MATAIYATDLTDIITDGTITSWTAIGGGKAGLAQELDYYIQGTSCISKEAWAGALKGMIYSLPSSITIPASGAVLVWITHQTANSMDTIANGGLRLLLGSSANAYNEYFIGGSDTIQYDDRWICVPITNLATADAVSGNPTATINSVGGTANMVGGPTKGAPFAIDAIRYGRVKFTYTEGDGTNGYANFDSAATFNDEQTRRYGQIQLSGKTYKIQGLHEFGTTTTPVFFVDNSRNIIINDTLKVESDFNGFSFNNNSSTIDWTNISISSLSSVSRGNFLVNDNPAINMESCTFSDMGVFTLNSNTTFTNSIFRRTDSITVNGATLTNCSIDNSIATTSAVITSHLSTITKSTFRSSGTGHAVELTDLGSGSMTWDNTLVGYATVNGSTGNEAIFVNVPSGSIDIVVETGASEPSIRTAGATVNVLVGQVTTTITVKDTANNIIQGATVLVKAGAGGNIAQGTTLIKANTDTLGQVSDTRSLDGDQPIVGYVRHASGPPYYKQSNILGTINSSTGLSLTIQMISDE